MKSKFIYCLPLLVFFLFSQILFLNHHVSDFEQTNHSDFCFVCVMDSPVFWSLSQDAAHLPVFKKDIFSKNNSLIFVKKELYTQFLPRSPPNTKFV